MTEPSKHLHHVNDNATGSCSQSAGRRYSAKSQLSLADDVRHFSLIAKFHSYTGRVALL